MPTPDRRHAPRTKLDQVAYIQIEPDKGAIVLNASGNGLGFHSMAPVDPTAPLRFSVQEQNRRVDICGELVWTDDFQKIGGVRFDTLSIEAREQILDWIRKSCPAPVERSTLGAALLKALPINDSRRSVLSFKPALAWWKPGRLKGSGFSRGLVSGFLLSLLGFSVVLFCYAYRGDFGELLVRLGERLGANRDAGAALRSVPSAAVPANSTAAVKEVPIFETKSASAATPGKHDVSSGYDKELSTTSVPTRIPSPALRTQPMSAMPDLAKAKTSETKIPGAKNSGSTQRQPIPAAISPPSINAVISAVKGAQFSTSGADQVATLMRGQTALPVAVAVSPLNGRSDIQMFFEVGRFKKGWMAQDLSNKVAQLGIRTSVVQRGHFWMSSYQVLAGPYDNEAAEKQLRDQLLSHGYDPRPYERGSRDFSFRSRVNIRNSELPTGDFDIAWETYVADTKVKFMQGRYLVAAIEGKWVHSNSKFLNNEYVYQIQPDGSRPLQELHFAGMDRALVLRNLQ
jgi:hypothetical protein